MKISSREVILDDLHKTNQADKQKEAQRRRWVSFAVVILLIIAAIVVIFFIAPEFPRAPLADR